MTTDRKNPRTRAFQLYEEGKRYNNSLTPNYYTLVDTNTEFYAGNQWVHLPQTPAMSRLPKPVFNIIKRTAGILISQVTSNGISVSLEPLSYYDGGEGDGTESGAVPFAQAEVNNLLEKLKMEYRVREALTDGAQTGDYCAHFYWDPEALPYGGASGEYRGEIKMELVDGVNVMFGNPGTADVQSQPYVLLVGRDTVMNLRREYLERHPGDESGALRIQPDGEWREQAASGGKLELSGDETAKALFLYLYEKTRDGNGTNVRVSKCCRNVSLFEDVDTGLSEYPIAWGNWEKQKNCYHGRALTTGVIQNQIFINRMFAMVMRHLQLEAFPKTVYNADVIGQWSGEIGQAIAVHGLQPGDPINQVAANLNPPDMSGQIMKVIEQAITLTRECLGVTDVQMGDVKSENTSAIMVMQSNAEVPLENIRSGMYEWIEDVVKILLDMMGTYYGKRPIVRTRRFEVPSTDAAANLPVMNRYTGLLKTVTEERRVMENYDFTRLKHLWLGVRVDVGASTAYSEIAMTKTLDNLRAAGILDVIEYLERIPDKLVPQKQKLLQQLRTEQAQEDGILAGQALPDSQVDRETQGIRRQINEKQQQGQPGGSDGGGNLLGRGVDQDDAVSMLPSNVRAQFDNLPARAQNVLAKSMSMKLNR